MFGVIDVAILAVGITVAPLLPDLAANLWKVWAPVEESSEAVARVADRLRTQVAKYVGRFLSVVIFILFAIALHFHHALLPLFYPNDAMLERLLHYLFAWYTAMLAVVSFAAAVWRSPGHVKDYIDRIFSEEERKLMPVCKKCGVRKPPRSHHCRVCGSCVLRMDHHCPFTMNCIGTRNQADFVRFLFAVCVGLVYATTFALPPFEDCLWRADDPSHTRALTVEVCEELGKVRFLLVLVVFVFFPSLFLLCWQLYVGVSGETTIELFARVSGKRKGKEQQDYRSSAMLKNFKSVMGVGTAAGAVLSLLFPTPPLSLSAIEKRAREGVSLHVRGKQ